MTAQAIRFKPDEGFLPAIDPLSSLPGEFSAWEHMAQQLPKWLLSDRLRAVIESLPPFPLKHLQTAQQHERAMLILSFLSHAYVWGGGAPVQTLPRTLALPWYAVAGRLGRPPVLSYASYALNNWRRLEPTRGVELGNIALLQNFLGGIDEEWFILIHVDIEARATPAIAAIDSALEAAREDDADTLTAALQTIAGAIEAMCATLARMPEHCDPAIYYQRVRPFIHGWNNNPALPEGLIYEGVDAYGGEPQTFRGETGAQSSIIPALDALLGIEHRDDPLKFYLLEMRDYMPPPHRAFINRIGSESAVRETVLQAPDRQPALVAAYNQCIQGITRFRTMHLEYAARYIQQQAESGAANPTEVGTGGTPFMRYLGKHQEETSAFLVR